MVSRTSVRECLNIHGLKSVIPLKSPQKAHRHTAIHIQRIARGF
jgi:hypothetical protein